MKVLSRLARAFSTSVRATATSAFAFCVSTGFAPGSGSTEPCRPMLQLCFRTIGPGSRIGVLQNGNQLSPL